MSTETHHRTEHTAQFARRCSLCRVVIERGERYVSAHGIGEDGPYRSPWHRRCIALADASPTFWEEWADSGWTEAGPGLLAELEAEVGGTR